MTSIDATIYATTDTPLGNGAFTADGRLVVSHHPMYATPHRVSIFAADGSLEPWPSLAWNTPQSDPMQWIDAVLGLRDDRHGRIWLADMGTRSDIPPKFVVWDTIADALWRVIPIPPDTITRFSEPNDFVIDEARGKLYIADEGAGRGGDGSRAALIVLDLATGEARRRLEGHDGIRAEAGPLTIGDQRVERNQPDGSRMPLHVGVDGIAMDAAGEWLYLSPLNGHSLWRLRVDDLLDEALDDPALAQRLERYAAKPNSGGMWIDANGDIYLTVIETNAIGRISAADRRYDEPIVRDDMFWPDGIMQGPDGAVYVVVTQLPHSPALARPGEKPEFPFQVFRFEPSGGSGRASMKTNRTEPVLGWLAAGAVAGLTAALATSLFEKASKTARLAATGADSKEPPPTDALADKIYHGATGGALKGQAKTAAGMAIHFAMGAGLGAAYALLTRRWPAVAAGRGSAYGLAVWASVEETGLALLGLKPSPWRVAPADHAFTAASHLVFGVTLSAAFDWRQGDIMGSSHSSSTHDPISSSSHRAYEAAKRPTIKGANFGSPADRE